MAQYAFVEIEHVVTDWCFWSRMVKSMVKVTPNFWPEMHHHDNHIYVSTDYGSHYYFDTDEAALDAVIALRSAYMELDPQCACAKHEHLYLEMQTPRGALPVFLQRTTPFPNGPAFCKFGRRGLKHRHGLQIMYETEVDRDKALTRFLSDRDRARSECGWDALGEVEKRQAKERADLEAKQKAEMAETAVKCSIVATN